MAQEIILYHGSINILEEPEYGRGRKNNDFGRGVYCTKHNELAKEWAVSSLENGFSNRYSFNMEHLKILNLNSREYTILNWIAVLVEHRLFTIDNPGARRAKRYLMDNFGINVNAYDVVIGYRADDSYFDFAEAFLNNSITVNQLAGAMKLGELGEQIVLKSQYSFSKLKYEGYEVVLSSEHFDSRRKRNENAIEQYYKLLENEDDGLYIQDIIRGGVTNEDSRIPRNVFE